MLHPRPRTLWSRWLETVEAYSLERQWDKESIFEFYLNQIPYGGRRRGVLQGAHYYFGRDLGTLSKAEMLSLAVLVRAPTTLNPKKHPEKLLKRLEWLAAAMGLDPKQEESLTLVKQVGFDLSEQVHLEIEAAHFAEYVRKQYPLWAKKHGVQHSLIATTLNGGLQNFAQNLLDREIQNLRQKNVNHGALLIADHQNGDILAWAVSRTTDYNAVLVPRQPGSTMKPFVYALAFEKGWTPATIIVDEPLLTPVGRGVHSIRNYSRQYYGPVTVREALGNSLNTPAIKAVKFIEPQVFYHFLKKAGISSLTEEPGYYGEGLALGSAEVSLLELMQAYTAFANQGRVRPLRWSTEEPTETSEILLDPMAASLVAHIMADPKARLLEFGRHSILNFPSSTSVKTGTATDYRDAWAIGFNGRFLVGVWMGDLEHQPSAGNTGARGPALILRSVFHQLEQEFPGTRELPLHPALVGQELCRDKSLNVVKADGLCASYLEYFLPGTELSHPGSPGRSLISKQSKKLLCRTFSERESWACETPEPRISFPLSHLQLAWDPRLPAKAQGVMLKIENTQPGDRFRWWINNKYLGESREAKMFWPLSRGPQNLQAEVVGGDGRSTKVKPVSFLVK